MRNLWLDFESYYDTEYSLRKMTPPEYVLSPQFEALGCAFAWEGKEPFWVDGPDIGAFFKPLDLTDTRAISHNAAFDMLILSLRYKVFPAAYGCTLSMARNWISHQTGSVSLDACCKRYGLPLKSGTIAKMAGVNFHQLKHDKGLYDAEVAYGLQDVANCRALYQTMLDEGFPESELDVIDWVVRMAAQPQFEFDQQMITEHLSEVRANKEQLLAKASMDDRANLMSDDKLAAILIMLGVQPPRKMSKVTKKETWAFAKTDKEFTDLLEHPDPTIQAVVAARIGHKSTLEETRSERLLAISRCTLAAPIPLKYSGAHTHRFSGDWKINVQNLANGSKLRHALRAPKGKLVVSVDASQIEARLNAELSGETWLLDAFREGRDVYAEFAADVYGRPIDKRLDPNERFVGKTGILSLGYGSSAEVFQNMVRNKSTNGFIMSKSLAFQTVAIYRTKCAKIVDHWRVADRQIVPQIAQGIETYWGPLKVGRERLILPNGNMLRYNQLRHEYHDDRTGWLYNRGDRIHKLYGAKLVENECQSLAFVHIAAVAMSIWHQTEKLLWPAHQVHDELIYVVDEKIAEKVAQIVVAEMSRSPDWLPNIPLAAESHIGKTYGDTK